MTSYTVQVGTDNRGPKRLIVGPDLAFPAIPLSIDVIITGASTAWRAPTEASGYREAVQWDEIEELFSSHLERFDSLYRRLA